MNFENINVVKKLVLPMKLFFAYLIASLLTWIIFSISSALFWFLAICYLPEGDYISMNALIILTTILYTVIKFSFCYATARWLFYSELDNKWKL